jgi:hypothetical protein
MNRDLFDTPLEYGIQSEERAALLVELSDTARAMHGYLSDGRRSGEKTPFEKALDDVGSERVDLPSKLVAIPLDESIFKDLNLPVPTNLRFLLQQYNFYLVHFPLTLVPHNDWEFDWLECRVAFNQDRPPKEQPVIYQIFPEQEWQEVLHAWESLEVGLDQNLEFKLDPTRIPDLQVILDQLKLPVKASIEAKLAGKGGLLMGPFEYRLKKARVISQGRGNMMAIWRLYGKEQVLYREPRLGIVLQVPKSVNVVSAEGRLFVQRTYPMPRFRGDWQDLKTQVAEKLHSFIDRGAPLEARRPWPEILPST